MIIVLVLLGQILELRAPIQRLVDVVASWFVPTVVLAAIIAAAAMSLSSISVISNALRLSRVRL